MEKNKKSIVVTGAAGFIGSCMIRQLNDAGYTNIIAVDDFGRADKNRNLDAKKIQQKIDRHDFLSWLTPKKLHNIDVVIHLGARTDTTEKDWPIFENLNLNYSKILWNYCCTQRIPLIYASSAATYGMGELGYEDRHDIVHDLRPLNPYGDSKNEFDKWVLSQIEQPPFWAGLKFFNVYGPNEYHKGRMASVIFHTCRKIKDAGMMKLFKSHRKDYRDGEQSRDFIYVKDVVNVIQFLYEHQPESAIYNLGTGKARTFLALATNTFEAMQVAPNINFIDTPEDIRDTYQYFTEANIQKLRQAGYGADFYSLEDGIHDYVTEYLMEEKIF